MIGAVSVSLMMGETESQDSFEETKRHRRSGDITHSSISVSPWKPHHHLNVPRRIFGVIFFLSLVTQSKQACSFIPLSDATRVVASASGNYSLSDVVILACNSTGHYTPTGTPFSVCIGNDTWIPDPSSFICHDQCSANLFPLEIEHSPEKDKPKLFYDHNEVIRLSCGEGATLKGSDMATCRDGVLVMTSSPECRADCPSPNLATPMRNFSDGDVATFSCPDHTTQPPLSTATCRNGTWDPPFNCFGKCETLSIPESGLLLSRSPDKDGLYDHGDIITFTCSLDDHVITGVDMTRCDNGSWIPPGLSSCQQEPTLGPSNADRTNTSLPPRPPTQDTPIDDVTWKSTASVVGIKSTPADRPEVPTSEVPASLPADESVLETRTTESNLGATSKVSLSNVPSDVGATTQDGIATLEEIKQDTTSQKFDASTEATSTSSLITRSTSSEHHVTLRDVTTGATALAEEITTEVSNEILMPTRSSINYSTEEKLTTEHPMTKTPREDYDNPTLLPTVSGRTTSLLDFTADIFNETLEPTVPDWISEEPPISTKYTTEMHATNIMGLTEGHAEQRTIRYKLEPTLATTATPVTIVNTSPNLDETTLSEFVTGFVTIEYITDDMAVTDKDGITSTTTGEGSLENATDPEAKTSTEHEATVVTEIINGTTVTILEEDTLNKIDRTAETTTISAATTTAIVSYPTLDSDITDVEYITAISDESTTRSTPTRNEITSKEIIANTSPNLDDTTLSEFVTGFVTIEYITDDISVTDKDGTTSTTAGKGSLENATLPEAKTSTEHEATVVTEIINGTTVTILEEDTLNKIDRTAETTTISAATTTAIVSYPTLDSAITDVEYITAISDESTTRPTSTRNKITSKEIIANTSPNLDDTTLSEFVTGFVTIEYITDDIAVTDKDETTSTTAGKGSLENTTLPEAKTSTEHEATVVTEIINGTTVTILEEDTLNKIDRTAETTTISAATTTAIVSYPTLDSDITDVEYITAISDESTTRPTPTRNEITSKEIIANTSPNLDDTTLSEFVTRFVTIEYITDDISVTDKDGTTSTTAGKGSLENATLPEAKTSTEHEATVVTEIINGTTVTILEEDTLNKIDRTAETTTISAATTTAIVSYPTLDSAITDVEYITAISDESTTRPTPTRNKITSKEIIANTSPNLDDTTLSEFVTGFVTIEYITDDIAVTDKDGITSTTAGKGSLENATHPEAKTSTEHEATVVTEIINGTTVTILEEDTLNKIDRTAETTTISAATTTAIVSYPTPDSDITDVEYITAISDESTTSPTPTRNEITSKEIIANTSPNLDDTTLSEFVTGFVTIEYITDDIAVTDKDGITSTTAGKGSLENATHPEAKTSTEHEATVVTEIINGTTVTILEEDTLKTIDRTAETTTISASTTTAIVSDPTLDSDITDVEYITAISDETVEPSESERSKSPVEVTTIEKRSRSTIANQIGSDGKMTQETEWYTEILTSMIPAKTISTTSTDDIDHATTEYTNATEPGILTDKTNETTETSTSHDRTSPVEHVSEVEETTGSPHTLTVTDDSTDIVTPASLEVTTEEKNTRNTTATRITTDSKVTSQTEWYTEILTTPVTDNDTTIHDLQSDKIESIPTTIIHEPQGTKRFPDSTSLMQADISSTAPGTGPVTTVLATEINSVISTDMFTTEFPDVSSLENIATEVPINDTTPSGYQSTSSHMSEVDRTTAMDTMTEIVLTFVTDTVDDSLQPTTSQKPLSIVKHVSNATTEKPFVAHDSTVGSTVIVTELVTNSSYEMTQPTLSEESVSYIEVTTEGHIIGSTMASRITPDNEVTQDIEWYTETITYTLIDDKRTDSIIPTINPIGTRTADIVEATNKQFTRISAQDQTKEIIAVTEAESTSEAETLTEPMTPESVTDTIDIVTEVLVGTPVTLEGNLSQTEQVIHEQSTKSTAETSETPQTEIFTEVVTSLLTNMMRMSSVPEGQVSTGNAAFSHEVQETRQHIAGSMQMETTQPVSLFGTELASTKHSDGFEPATVPTTPHTRMITKDRFETVTDTIEQTTFIGTDLASDTQPIVSDEEYIGTASHTTEEESTDVKVTTEAGTIVLTEIVTDILNLTVEASTSNVPKKATIGTEYASEETVAPTTSLSSDISFTTQREPVTYISLTSNDEGRPETSRKTSPYIDSYETVPAEFETAFVTIELTDALTKEGEEITAAAVSESNFLLSHAKTGDVTALVTTEESETGITHLKTGASILTSTTAVNMEGTDILELISTDQPPKVSHLPVDISTAAIFETELLTYTDFAYESLTTVGSKEIQLSSAVQKSDIPHSEPTTTSEGPNVSPVQQLTTVMNPTLSDKLIYQTAETTTGIWLDETVSEYLDETTKMTSAITKSPPTRSNTHSRPPSPSTEEILTQDTSSDLTVDFTDGTTEGETTEEIQMVPTTDEIRYLGQTEILLTTQPTTTREPYALSETYTFFSETLTTEIASSLVPTTESHTTIPTPEIDTTIPTTDIHTTSPTTGIHTTVPTTDIYTIVLTTDIDTTSPTTGIHTTVPTTGIHTTVPTTDIHTTVPTIDIHTTVGLPTIDIHTTVPTTDIHTTVPTTDIHTTVPTTDIHTIVLTTDIDTTSPTTGIHTTVPTTGIHTTVPTTDIHTTVPTTDIHTIVLTTDIDTTSPTTGIHTTVPTTGIHTTVPTTGIHTTVPTTDIHTTVPTTDIHNTVPTTDIHTTAPTTDIHTTVPTTDIYTTVPTTGIHTTVPTTDIHTTVPTTEIDTAIPTTDIHTTSPTTGIHTTVPTTDIHTIVLTTDIDITSPTTGIHTTVPTTGIHTTVPTIDIHTTVGLPTTDIHTTVPTTDIHTIGPTTDIHTTVPTTEIHTTGPTTEIDTTIPTTDIHTTSPTTGIHTTVPTTDIYTIVLTTDIDTTSPTTGIHTTVPTTDIHNTVPTTDIHTTAPTTDIHTTVPTTDIYTTVPTTGIHTTVPTTDIHTTVPTTGIHTTVPTTDIHTTGPTTDIQALLTTDIHTSVPTTDIHTTVPTTDIHTTVPTTDIHTTVPPTDIHTTVPATDIPTTVLTTDILTKVPTTDIHTTVPTTDIHTTVPTTDIHTTVPTTDIHATVPTTNTVPTDNIHTTVATTDIHTPVPTTDIRTILPTTDINTPVLTTDIHTTVPTTAVHSIVPTTGIHTPVPTTGIHTTVPTTDFHTPVPTTGIHTTVPTKHTTILPPSTTRTDKPILQTPSSHLISTSASLSTIQLQTTPSISEPGSTMEPTCGVKCEEPNEVCIVSVDGDYCRCVDGHQRVYGVCKEVFTFKADVKIVLIKDKDAIFTSDLTDPSSLKFRELETEFCQAMEIVYKTHIPTTTSFFRCDVIAFRSGSIIVDYIIRFTSPAIDEAMLTNETLVYLKENGMIFPRELALESALVEYEPANECLLNISDCHPNAECIDTGASHFTCKCSSGYNDLYQQQLPGRYCTAIQVSGVASWVVVLIVIGILIIFILLIILLVICLMRVYRMMRGRGSDDYIVPSAEAGSTLLGYGYRRKSDVEGICYTGQPSTMEKREGSMVEVYDEGEMIEHPRSRTDTGLIHTGIQPYEGEQVLVSEEMDRELELRMESISQFLKRSAPLNDSSLGAKIDYSIMYLPDAPTIHLNERRTSADQPTEEFLDSLPQTYL